MTTYRGWQIRPDGVHAKRWIITPSAAALSPRPMALVADADGVAVLEDEDGRAVAYPVFRGQILPFSPVKFLASATISGVVTNTTVTRLIAWGDG